MPLESGFLLEVTASERLRLETQEAPQNGQNGQSFQG